MTLRDSDHGNDDGNDSNNAIIISYDDAIANSDNRLQIYDLRLRNTRKVVTKKLIII